MTNWAGQVAPASASCSTQDAAGGACVNNERTGGRKRKRANTDEKDEWGGAAVPSDKPEVFWRKAVDEDGEREDDEEEDDEREDGEREDDEEEDGEREDDEEEDDGMDSEEGEVDYGHDMPGTGAATTGAPGCTIDHKHIFFQDYTKNHWDPIEERPGYFLEFNEELDANKATNGNYKVKFETTGHTYDMSTFGEKGTPINLSTATKLGEGWKD